MTSAAHPASRIQRGRKITGMSAVLLPIDGTGAIDWDSFRRLLERTVDAGLVPAVNMDTGYVQLLGADERLAVLDATQAVAGDGFVAGAHVADAPGDAWDRDATVRAMEPIEARGGLP